MHLDIAKDLNSLLHPISPEIFFSEYWNRRALHIQGSNERFRDLFDRMAFDRAAEHCELLKASYKNELGNPVEKQIHPAQSAEMLAIGATICAGGLDHADSKLAAFITDFSQHFVQMGKFYFNSYLSPAGKGFGLHLDDHPVWILQIEGRKRWWYSERPGLDALMSTVTFPPGVQVQQLPWGTVTRPDESTFAEAVLYPGDILYLPKGAWHRAEAIGGSLALTLAELPATAVDVIQQTVLPKSRCNTILLDAMSAFSTATLSTENPPEQLEKQLDGALQEVRKLFASLTPADLYEAWKAGKIQEKPL
jgi:ribosomal protein L16 Arg81 hydroxylase